MSKPLSMSVKIGTVLALIVVVALVVTLKGGAPTDAAKAKAAASAPSASTPSTGRPRLLELGSVSCIPCKAMAPILEELGKEYDGALQVDFIDVKQNHDAAVQYGVKIIPTQVFFDAEGVERFRHEGFFAKADILAKWKGLGIEFKPASRAPGK